MTPNFVLKHLTKVLFFFFFKYFSNPKFFHKNSKNSGWLFYLLCSNIEVLVEGHISNAQYKYFYGNHFHIFSFLEMFFLSIFCNFLFGIIYLEYLEGATRKITYFDSECKYFFARNHFNDSNIFGLQCRMYADIIDVISVLWRGFNKMKMLFWIFRGKIQVSL